MVVVPEVNPNATPEPAPMPATARLLLLHAPPALTSVSVTEEPTQTVLPPPIAAGDGFTVTGVVT